MKKIVLFVCLVFLMSGCRTSKNTESSYKELETSSQSVEKEKQQNEEYVIVKKEEKEKKTAEISEKTEFYPPTSENPSGGAPKIIERAIYLTDEKAINEVVENYQKQLIEKDEIISSLKKEIELLESKKVESDSRPVQDSEWLWVGIAFFVVVAVVILIYYMKKKSISLSKIFKKIF